MSEIGVSTSEGTELTVPPGRFVDHGRARLPQLVQGLATGAGLA